MTVAKLTIQQLDTAFPGRIPEVRITPIYRVAVLLVACGMVILPLVYTALLGLSVYGVYYHATENVSLFSEVRSLKGALFLYVTPLVVGTTLVVFMVKPLFARAAQSPSSVSLERADEPLVFGLVDRLCAAVGAPRPSRIDVNCDVNASASFRAGLGSMLTNDLVLTIGLPLVAGLSLRQLTGVLAHEFGHFAQGSGMRLTYVIRSVNLWFARVVYGRDAWDAWLTEAARESDVRIGIVLHVARAFVWLTRLVLTVLMYVGHAMSCFLLRQMEFDADRYEARIAGSRVFGTTASLLPRLSVAHHGAQSDVSVALRDKRLSDDFIAVVLHNDAQLSDELQKAIASNIESGRTRFFDTHPCDRERIASAEAEACDGVFTLDAPAVSLFQNFAELSRRCSLAFYREQLAADVDERRLVPSEDFLSEQRTRDAEMKALCTYSDARLDIDRPIPLDLSQVSASLDTDSDRAALAASRKALDGMREQVAPRHGKGALEAHARWSRALQARALLEAGLRITPENFGLAKSDLAEAMALCEAVDRERIGPNELLTPFDEAVARHITLGLRLSLALDLPRSRDLLALRDVYELLAREHATTAALEACFIEQAGLFESLDGSEVSASLRDAVMARTRRLVELLGALHAAFARVPYPFEHADGAISLAEAVIPELPTDPEDVGQAMAAAHRAGQRIDGVRARVLSRLILTALEVEQAPLAAPSA